jgi:hypothetical protein
VTFYVDTCSVSWILFNFCSIHYMFNFTYNITLYCHSIKRTHFIDTYVVNSIIFKDVKISHLITYVKTFRKNLLPPFRDVRKCFFFPSSFPTKMFYFYIFVKSHLSLITQTIFWWIVYAVKMRPFNFLHIYATSFYAQIISAHLRHFLLCPNNFCTLTSLPSMPK